MDWHFLEWGDKHRCTRECAECAECGRGRTHAIAQSIVLLPRAVLNGMWQSAAYRFTSMYTDTNARAHTQIASHTNHKIQFAELVKLSVSVICQSIKLRREIISKLSLSLSHAWCRCGGTELKLKIVSESTTFDTNAYVTPYAVKFNSIWIINVACSAFMLCSVPKWYKWALPGNRSEQHNVFIRNGYVHSIERHFLPVTFANKIHTVITASKYRNFRCEVDWQWRARGKQREREKQMNGNRISMKQINKRNSGE